MTPLEALKRIRQETCPATYNEDFDKQECCDTIEKALKVLEIFKSKMTAIYNIRTSPTTLHFDMDLTKDEFHLLEEILK